MSDRSELGPQLFRLVFLAWATYLIVKGMTVDHAGPSSELAAATYVVGGVILAALTLLPKRRSATPRVATRAQRGRSPRLLVDRSGGR
jgi:hypothetical protein